jgi:hypothetical protein
MENIGQTLKESGYLESLLMWREAPVTISDKKKRHLKVDLRIKLISIFLFSKRFLSTLMDEASFKDCYKITSVITLSPGGRGRG